MEKVRRRPDYESSNPVPSKTAVKSCQLQSIFHFYKIVFLNLCKKFTNAILLVSLTEKHFVVILSVAWH